LPQGPTPQRERLLVWLWRWCLRQPVAASLVGISIFLLVRGAVLTWSGLGLWVQPPRFTVGKETTYVTEPLDENDYMDYEALLNDRLAKGVTPATNANVLIIQALGPCPEGRPMLPDFYRRLGIEEPPERGDYFVSLGNHVKDQLKLPPGNQTDEVL